MKKAFAGKAAVGIILAFSALGLGQAAREQRLQDQAAGYSFSAPAGWKGNKGDAGFALVNPAETIIVSVRPHSYADFQTALRDTKLDPGFEVAGQPQDLKDGGKTIRVTKRSAAGVGVIDFFMLFSPNGGGVVVMALSDSANADAAFDAGLKISDSVAFAKPQQAGATSASSSGWASALSGKHLLYMYSGNGYFEEKHIYLCRDATFAQTTGSGGYTPGDSDGGSFGARGGRRGRWSVSGSTLVLQFQDGAVGQYNITKRTASNEIGLNGKRYFVQANAGC